MKLDIIDALDKLSILIVKKEKLTTFTEDLKTELQELTAYVKDFINHDVNQHYLDLLNVNRKIWECKALIDDTISKDLSTTALITIAGLNLKVLSLNNERRATIKTLKNLIRV